MKKILLFAVTLFWLGSAVAQNFTVDRAMTNAAVRDMIGEPSTVYLADTTLNRMINFAQHDVMLALTENTNVIIDTVVTSPTMLRYYLKDTKATSDSIIASRIAAVIHKDNTASGGKERALAYVPPQTLGRTGAGEVPAFYTVVGRNLLLGESPLGGDTLFLYMLPIPRDLSSGTTALSVAKEDQFAVILYSSALAMARDKQYSQAKMYWDMFNFHLGTKTGPLLNNRVAAPPAQ